jgi:hypothetical protein
MPLSSSCKNTAVLVSLGGRCKLLQNDTTHPAAPIVFKTGNRLDKARIHLNAVFFVGKGMSCTCLRHTNS